MVIYSDLPFKVYCLGWSYNDPCSNPCLPNIGPEKWMVKNWALSWIYKASEASELDWWNADLGVFTFSKFFSFSPTEQGFSLVNVAPKKMNMLSKNRQSPKGNDPRAISNFQVRTVSFREGIIQQPQNARVFFSVRFSNHVFFTPQTWTRLPACLRNPPGFFWVAGVVLAAPPLPGTLEFSWWKTSGREKNIHRKDVPTNLPCKSPKCREILPVPWIHWVLQRELKHGTDCFISHVPECLRPKATSNQFIPLETNSKNSKNTCKWAVCPQKEHGQMVFGGLVKYTPSPKINMSAEKGPF